MAGDYLPMRLDLAEDPAVIRMAAMLKIDELDVVGRLWAVWSWANRQSRDGHAIGVTSSWIDRYTRTPGLSAAMIDVGWLIESEEGITIPKYDRWNSKAAKTRLDGNARQARHREMSRVCHKKNVTDPSPTPSPEKRREEKRREEKDDHLCSWKEKLVKVSQLRDWCTQTFMRSPDGRPGIVTPAHLDKHPDTRRLLLQVGVLRLCGAISEACVQDGCEALRRADSWPDNPGGYLRTVWSNSKHAPPRASPTWFAELLADVNLPEEI